MRLHGGKSTAPDGRCLIVPSDIQVREFDAKLLFACTAAERGFPVVVGSKFDMHRQVEAWPRSYYLHKDVHSWPNMLQRLRRLDHRVLAWDEEGLVYISPQRYVQMRVSRKVLSAAEALFAWGPANARAWQDPNVYEGTPIHITGNPRGDLMRPELRGFFDDDVKQLQDRLGRFVLINTNFGRVNFVGTKSVRQHGAEWRRQAGAVDNFMDGLIAHRKRLFDHFLAMVPRLADCFPDVNIVVRPHPSEHHGPWREAAAGRKNVHVLHEGSVTPWLLACAVTVHNGCSTGLEAHVLGRPVVAYRPERAEGFDLPLPNAVSHEVSTLDDLLDVVSRALAGSFAESEAEDRRQREVVRENITGLDSRLASDRIVDVIEQIAGGGEGLTATLRRRIGRLGARIDTALSCRARKSAMESAVKRHKFPNMSVGEVEGKIDTLRRCLGRFGEIEAFELAPNIFQIARQ
jgi:surface carbohydrate biosynthesis protein